LKEKAQQKLEDAKENVQDFNENAQEKLEDAKENAQEKLEDAKENVQDFKENAQDKLEDLKENVQDRWESRGDQGESIDMRGYPRLSPECRYDESTGLPGIACVLSLEFSPIVVIEVALNIEFGLGNGGTALIAKLSTGIKTVAIPEGCDSLPIGLKRSGCVLAEKASTAFAKLFDIGGMINPILTDSVGIFPFQLRFPGAFKTGLIVDAYKLMDVPLFDFTTKGMCLSTVHSMVELKPMQKLTMQGVSVLMGFLGGDICFDTKLNQTTLDATGNLELGLTVKANMFDKTQVDFMQIIDFLPDHLTILVNKVRPALTKCLEIAQEKITDNFPEAMNFEIDVLDVLLSKLADFSGQSSTDLVAAMNTYTAPTPAPTIITIGSSVITTVVVTTQQTGLICPEVVDKNNWIGTMERPPTFSVQVVGRRISVTRTDAAAGWSFNLAFNCVPSPEENHYREVAGVGLNWGGICTCPDGQFYEVGDNGDSCGSLACEGGSSGTCGEGIISSENGGMKVTCTVPSGNWYRSVPNVGSWGGICTCPDGQQYEVGDNGDSCGSIACEGGVSGECGEDSIDPNSAGMKVTCDAPADGRRLGRNGRGVVNGQRSRGRGWNGRSLSEVASISDMLSADADGNAQLTIPAVVDATCMVASERRRKLRGEKQRGPGTRLTTPHGWVPTNIHPHAPYVSAMNDRRKLEGRALLNQGLVTFAEGTGCSINVDTFPVVLSCDIIIDFAGMFTLSPSVGATIDYEADGETLQILFGLGMESSPLPGPNVPVPAVLVNLGNFMRENMIDPGAMINPIFTGALQFPTEDQGFKFKFPAGDAKFHNLFAKTLGKLSDIQGMSICFSTLLDKVAEMNVPQEFADCASFLTQFRGYIGGDICIKTPAELSNAGALSLQLMLTFEVFKPETFDIFPLIKVFSMVNPALTSIWTILEQVINPEMMDTVNGVLNNALPSPQLLEFNIGQELIAAAQKGGFGGGSEDDRRRMSDVESLLCGGSFQFGTVPASCRPGSSASGSMSAGEATDACGNGNVSATVTTATSATATSATALASDQSVFPTQNYGGGSGGSAGSEYSTIAAAAAYATIGAISNMQPIAEGIFCAEGTSTPCVFPFVFNEVTFVGCTATQNMCATSVDAQKNYVSGAKCGTCSAATTLTTVADDEVTAADVTVQLSQEEDTHHQNQTTFLSSTTIIVGILTATLLVVTMGVFAAKRMQSVVSTKEEPAATSATNFGLQPAMAAL